MAGNQPLLDHIVILVPHSFLASPPKWITNLFTLYPGGKHADGVTQNTLVLFADGIYLELIAFVPGQDPSKRAAHKWGHKKEGTIIDWAMTLPKMVAEDDQEIAFKEVQTKVEGMHTGISYSDLIPGGRHRPDGVELQWATSAAYQRTKEEDERAVEPGLLPFWCLDKTPRDLRVPSQNPGIQTHPSGAQGIALLHVKTEKKCESENLAAIYDALLGPRNGKDTLEWKASGFAVHGDGPSSTVTLESDGAILERQVEIEIAFFTNSKDLVGRKIGGDVADGVKLEFGFIDGY